MIGTCALCAQMIFIRELMALFTGTEFAIGALMAGWLVWVGIGGMAGGRIAQRGRSEGVVVVIVVPREPSERIDPELSSS